MSLLEVSQLDFAYGERLVLKHINLMVQRGQTLGLTGPNGGGKTTLLKLMLGLLQPTRGKISIDGMSPVQATRQGDLLGYLPQRPQAPPNFPLNVRQIVRQGLIGKTGVLRSFAKEDLARVEALLEQVGVRELAEMPIGELSGGQQQRVFIARAVAARPKLLLLDEPTTGIDASAQRKFIEFFQALRKELDLTVVFTSHDTQVVEALSDQVVGLNVIISI